MSANQNKSRLVAKSNAPVRGVVGALVGILGVGYLHSYLLGPISTQHMFDVTGRNLFLADASIGIALVLLGSWLTMTKGFRFTSAFVLSSGLSIVGFWLLEMLAMLG